MSLEADEDRSAEEIWSDIENAVAEEEFEEAQEIIDAAERAGWIVGEMQKYLTEQIRKA